MGPGQEWEDGGPDLGPGDWKSGIAVAEVGPWRQWVWAGSEVQGQRPGVLGGVSEQDTPELRQFVKRG